MLMGLVSSNKPTSL